MLGLSLSLLIRTDSPHSIPLPVPPLDRIMLSQWWAPRPGMDSRKKQAQPLSQNILSYVLSHLETVPFSYVGTEAPLNSFLQEVLYKCLKWMREWIKLTRMSKFWRLTIQCTTFSTMLLPNTKASKTDDKCCADLLLLRSRYSQHQGTGD